MVDRSSGKQGGRAGGAGVQSGVPQTYPPALLTHRMLKSISVRPEGAPPGVAADAGYQVANSCRFNDDDSPYLNKTVGSAGDQKKWTISFWFKLGHIGVTRYFYEVPGRLYLQIRSDHKLEIGNATATILQTTNLYRDPHAWYHCVWQCDTAQAAAANRMKLFINNVECTYGTDARSAQITQSADLPVLSAAVHTIGEDLGQEWDGYLAEFILIEGLALTPSSFAETDDNGVWRPIDVSGLTFGTNGFYLDFKDSSALGNDVSGNNNDYSSSGLAANDQVTDTPTDNYCVMSPLTPLSTCTISDGGLVVVSSSDEDYCDGSIEVDLTDSDGWYWEVQRLTNVGNNVSAGIAKAGAAIDSGRAGDDPNTYDFYLVDGAIWHTSYLTNGTWDSESSGGIADDDWAAFAVKDGTMWIGDVVNGGGTINWYDAATKAEIEANTKTNSAFTGITGFGRPAFIHGGASSSSVTFNFGQHAFKGTDIPSGLKKISTANLPAPAIKDGTSAFQPTIYTGNGSSRNIDQTENSTFTPDLVWIKNRDQADEWKITDIARGVTKAWSSDATAGEDTDTNGLTSFDSDGFGLGSGAAGYNDNTEKFVAYQWLAGGGAGSSNTTGSLNTTSTSVNLAAGFSLSKYTGNGSDGATIGHGLGATPAFSIIKRTDDTGTAVVVSTGMAATKAGQLSENDAEVTLGSGYQVHTSSTLITLVDGTSSGANVNTSSAVYICYAWAEIAGFSSFGVYEGNNNADGPLVYTGFAPAWICCKNLDSATGGNWWTVDSARDTVNPADKESILDGTSAEDTDSSAVMLDFLSNGFKMRAGGSAANSANTFVYMAFAEHPFGGSGVSPATAR